jgi:hypothetical protein
VMRRATARIREEDGLLTPDKVVRWERGTVPQGSAADSLLRLLDAFHENARFLAGLHGVELSANGRKARTKAA